MKPEKKYPSLPALLLFSGILPFTARAAEPVPLPYVSQIGLDSQRQLVVRARVSAGFKHAVLEASSDPRNGVWESMIAGPMDGKNALVTFTMPEPGPFALVRVRVGSKTEVPAAKHSASNHYAVEYLPDDGGNGGNNNGGNEGSNGGYNGGNPGPTTEDEQIGHLLNRVAYGPSARSVDMVKSLGIKNYLEQQLNPSSVEETDTRLNNRQSTYYLPTIPGTETFVVKMDSHWSYFKGTQEPPADWKGMDFDDTTWLKGQAGFGYGDGDDSTVLEDAQAIDGKPGYLSVYVRQSFQVDDPSKFTNTRLRVFYDDGFVAYLNGTEIARANVAGSPPKYNVKATASGGNVDDDTVEADIDIQGKISGLLKPGRNVLAVQVHNNELTSSDFSLNVGLFHAPDATVPVIRGLMPLQDMVHARGIYSNRQLQTVLADFWQNHFCTDYDKLADYLYDLPQYRRLASSDAAQSLIRRQIAVECANMELAEYEFFTKNALGNFGDLLLFSATSPAMLIYLDNVDNLKAAPNENYAREILELYTFGVDNRYTQTDIEQLAKCFTGWGIRKVRPEARKLFPESARNPYTTPSLTVAETRPVLELGAGWRYFKGLSEPSPNGQKQATTDWTKPEFNDSSWTSGASGIGYGDNDDATNLTDMKGKYLSVYARREFTWTPPTAEEEPLLEIAYDDGYVAYLNGVEIGRSRGMRNGGSPTKFDYKSDVGHEVTEEPDIIPLRKFADIMRPAPEKNVLAIQVHNNSIDSGDLSMLPKISHRRYTADSIELTSSAGLWTFRFDPEQHSTTEKVLFKGSPYEIPIPANRLGAEGVQDALQVIDAMVKHPSTSEFIVLKLVNKFVSDEISLETYGSRTAPADLLKAVDDGIRAWRSTTPQGNITTVMRAILDPDKRASAFWTGRAFRTKVKTSLEFLNSAVRALDGTLVNNSLRARNEAMGMVVFQRDEPNGYAESGYYWMDTQALLERQKFTQALAINQQSTSASTWNIDATMSQYGLKTASSLVDFLNARIFQGTLTEEGKAVVLEFANTDETGKASPVDSMTDKTKKQQRLREMIGLLLAAPEFQFQ